MKRIIIITLLLGLGFISNLSIAATDKDAAKAAISAANGSLKKAASVDGEWRDTRKIIKKAKEASKKGHFEKAIKLANKAERQGKMGYEQAMAQKDLKMPAYLH